MYTVRPRRYNSHNRTLFNKIFQTRGSRWRQEVLAGTFADPRMLEDGFEWIPDFASSVMFLMSDQQMPALEQALDGALNPHDRAFLICACIEAELLHKSGSFRDEILDELLQYIRQQDEMSHELKQVCRHAVKGFLSRRNSAAVSDLVNRIVQLIANGTERQQLSGVEVLGSIYELIIKSDSSVEDLGLLNRYELCTMLALIHRSGPGAVCDVEDFYGKFGLPLTATEKEAFDFLDSRFISMELKPVFVSTVALALQQKTATINEGQLLRVLLDGSTICSVPFFVNRDWNRDPDDLLDQLDQMNLSDSPGIPRIFETLKRPVDNQTGVISAVSLFATLVSHNTELSDGN